jgi:hypothetical protein
VFAALIPVPRGFIEHSYSTFLYPHLQRIITPASNLTAFALFDAFVIAIMTAWLLALILDIRRVRGWKRIITRALLRSVIWACLLYIAFVCLCGRGFFICCYSHRSTERDA